MAKILICDDEKDIVKALTIYLSNANYNLLSASDGEKALEIMKEQEVDLVLLDIMMPRMDGLQALVKIREFSNIPVILLTAKSEESDIILGLNLGADDYITKPFNILEVKARIKAIMRRTTPAVVKEQKLTQIHSGDVMMDTESRRLFIQDKEINVTSKEFDMLLLLVTNPGKVYSRDSLLETIWGKDYPGDARTVDVHIRRLREKIEPNASEPRYVHTKWGVGYYYQQ